MLTDKHFIDWEGEMFGYGYGTGEQYTLKAIKDFFHNLEDGRSYSYEVLEEKMGKAECWFIINLFCKEGIIEYGTSPRFAWIEEKGQLLKEYLKDKTVDYIYDLVMVGQEYVHCYKDGCNCDDPCNNPLFKLN